MTPFSHEEAATRLMLSLAHPIRRGHKCLMIKIVDTALIAKGSKYRESCKVDWDKIYHFCVKLLTSMHCNGLNGNW